MKQVEPDVSRYYGRPQYLINERRKMPLVPRFASLWLSNK